LPVFRRKYGELFPPGLTRKGKSRRRKEGGGIKAGYDPKPSAAIIDSQGVKTSGGGEERDVDVHKQTPGRKRPLLWILWACA
jgi:hypothetical protein